MARARFAGKVDAGPARDAVNHLLASGATLTSISDRVGASRRALRALADGRWAWTSPDISTSLQQLAYGWVPHPPVLERPRREPRRPQRWQPDPGTVPILGAARRVQALVAIGWPAPVISAALRHMTPPGQPYIAAEEILRRASSKARRLGDKWIPQATMARVARLYEANSMRPGPSQEARRYARRWRWAPPLAWPEGDAIDDPEVRPVGIGSEPAIRPADDVDQAAVYRRCRGDLSVPVTPAEARLIVQELRQRGESYLSIERRTGLNVRRHIANASTCADVGTAWREAA